jgi:amino acid adenylation domain-containing protein
MFVNTLALRNEPAGHRTFGDFLLELKIKTLTAYSNADYPFEELVDKIVVSRNTSRNPLFDVMFNHLQEPGAPAGESGAESNILNLHRKSLSKFDFSLTAVEYNDNLLFNIEYCTLLFKAETIDRIAGYFKKIIASVIEDPGRQVSGIEIISEEEKRRILFDFNDTTADYPKDKSLHGLFEEQVKRTPDHIAVFGCGRIRTNTDDNMSITYRVLNEQSNQLAHLLKQTGVQPDTIVGIMTGRSIEMIIGIMAILKAGGAYLPIDPDYPEERINYMLKDSSAGILLKGNVVGPGKSEIRISKSETKPNDQNPNDQNKVNPPIVLNFEHLNFEFVSNFEFRASDLNSSNLAYIIYTSGSTGKPKGVPVPHGSVVNVLWALFKKYPLLKGDTYLLKTTYTFDVSVSELFGWFLGGGRMAILEPGGEKDPQKILNWVEPLSITHINFVPSMFGVFLDVLDPENIDKLSRLKYIFLAGEVLLPHLIMKFKKLNTGIVLENIYGPTESTIYASQYSLSQWKGEGVGNIPIGKPLQNLRLYILNRYNQIQPIGVSGELCISGEGLARGYLNRTELTNEKFIANTLVEKERFYRSGDLVRWLPDGNVEFLGRMDHQVKIRGYRIELGEIESQLLKHDEIKEAVVAVKEGKTGGTGGDKCLCAYIVSDTKIDISELIKHLSRELPDYMIPSYFEQLKEIPLTSSGKIDRRALPSPDVKSVEEYVAPRNQIEEKLVEIWSEVLAMEKEKIGIDDNFFQLGGHSLNAIVAVSKIHKEVDIKLPFPEFFRISTIRGLSEYLRGSGDNKYESIPAVEKKTHYEVSSAQKRIYISQQVDLKNTNYNMPGIFEFKGKLNRKKFEKAFQNLIERHEALRTSFCLVNDKTVQRINDYVEFRLSYKKLNTEEDVRNRINEFVMPFNLSQAPLFRVEFIELKEEKYFILFDIHHIISDGSSMQTLINDPARLYEGKNLMPLPVQYKDYTAWQNKLLNEERIKKQERYWLKKLEGFVFTQFPGDHFNSYHHTEGKEERLKIESSLYNKIEKFCNKHNVTKFVFMITAFGIVLSKGIDQADITIGIPVSIREHSDLKTIIGIFLNVLLIRTIIDDENTFLNHLVSNKKTIIDALNNQDYPYEMLYYKIQENTLLKKNELFSIFFNYFPLEKNQEIFTDDFYIRPLENPGISPKYDINFYTFDAYEYMTLNVVYKSNIYDEYSIKKLLEELLKVIRGCLQNENITISELVIPGEEEYDDFDAEFEKYYNNK